MTRPCCARCSVCSGTWACEDVCALRSTSRFYSQVVLRAPASLWQLLASQTFLPDHPVHQSLPDALRADVLHWYSLHQSVRRQRPARFIVDNKDKPVSDSLSPDMQILARYERAAQQPSNYTHLRLYILGPSGALTLLYVGHERERVVSWSPDSSKAVIRGLFWAPGETLQLQYSILDLQLPG